MDKIIDSIPKEKLIRELSPDKFMKYTSKGNNKIYSFTFHNAPSLMYEVARLREKAFRQIGCGTGKVMDLDEYDVNSNCFRQLIVWNPRDKEIVGGYRYAVCNKYLSNQYELSMPHYFGFSKTFIYEYLPHCIELGRAWVNPDYQPGSGERKSIFALDNLWDGIGSIIRENRNLKYLYGKITFSPTYSPIARFLLLWLLDNYFRDKKKLVVPVKPETIPDVLSVSGINVQGNNFEQDYYTISKYIRNLGITIPPLVSAYIGLASKITTFGTTINPELGYSFETGLMIDLNDIYPEKYNRYVFNTGKKAESITQQVL